MFLFDNCFRSDFIYDLFDTLTKVNEERSTGKKTASKKPKKPTVSSQFKVLLVFLFQGVFRDVNSYFSYCNCYCTHMQFMHLVVYLVRSLISTPLGTNSYLFSSSFCLGFVIFTDVETEQCQSLFCPLYQTKQ